MDFKYKKITACLAIVASATILLGCQNKQINHQFGTMAGVGPGCQVVSPQIRHHCGGHESENLSDTRQVLLVIRGLVKAKKFAQAEQLLNQAILISSDTEILKHSLIDVYVRQKKWTDALSLINELAIAVNEPVRLAIEARVGQFSEGTDYSLLPQIYQNEINQTVPLRATVLTDHLTDFDLTRVDVAATGVASTEPSIKVSNDGQHILVAWMEHINFPVHLPWHQKGRSAYSSDGGQNWTHLTAGSEENIIELFDLDLITAYDPVNNYMYTSGISWADSLSEYSDFLYFYRLDLENGLQQGPFLVQGDDPGNFPAAYDKALIAVDDLGGLFLTTYVPGTVKYSGDFAETFADVADLPDGMAHPRVKEGCLYLVSQTSPQFWRCDLPQDGGITTPASDNWWGYEDKVSGVFQVHNLTYMALHPNGDIYIVYSELQAVGSDELAIWMSRSVDNGDTWEDAWIVSADFPGDQFLPWIEIDTTGVIHLSYVDTRNNPQPDDATVTYLDTYYSHSSDGGQTWLETRVTPYSFELIDGVSYGYTYSDYNEMAVGNPDAVFLSFPWALSGNDMNMFVAKKQRRNDLIFRHSF